MGLCPFRKQHDFRALCLRQRIASGPNRLARGLYPETSKGRNQYVTIGDKKVFSSNLINDARFTFTRSKMRAFVTGENPALQFFSFYGENRQDGTVTVTGRTHADRPERIYS